MAADMSRASPVVDWQVRNTTNAERAKHLLDMGLHSDCEFLVGTSGNQINIKSHKILLSLGSPVFETMFYGGLSVSQFPVEVSDVQPEAFRSLLEYIYTEKLSFSSFSHACDVCYAAKKYIVPSLVQLCADYMWKDLGPENVCRAIEFSNFYEDTSLLARCMEVVRSSTRSVLTNPSFEEAEESTVIQILSLDEMEASELELFQAILRWGRKELTRRDLPETELRQVLNSALTHIRFLTMTSEQFASGPALSGVLTIQESHDIFMNLSSRGICPIPANLSGSTQARLTVAETFQPPQTSDSSKIFCYRRLEQESAVRNDGILDSFVTFTTDRNICIHGLIVGTQVQRAVDQSPRGASYMELLYCQLLDKDGTRLTYVHFSGRAVRNSTLDVYFNRPVYVQRNRDYRLSVMLNQTGHYPLGNAAKSVLIQGVYFRFGGTLTSEPLTLADVRDSIIRGVIFSF